MQGRFSKLHVMLEILGIVVMIGMIVFVGIRYADLPELIPGHYNSLGEIDRWGSKSEIFIIPIVAILIYVGISTISFFPGAWNIPIKLTAQNQDQVFRCIRSMILFTKLEMLGIFSCIIYYVSYMKPLPVSFTPVTLIILFVTILFFVFRLLWIGKRN